MAAGAVYPRPEGMSFPTTWIRFRGKKPMEDGRIPEFWVQDATDDMFETIIDIMCAEYATTTPFSRASGLFEDPESLEETRVIWRRILASRLSPVALTMEHGVPVIAGMNILTVVNTKEPSPLHGQGKARRIISGAIRAQEREANLFKRYGHERALYAVGLLVRPAFRGQGVAEQLLLARDPLCRGLGLRLTYTCFSSGGAQTSARRAGYTVVHEQRYDEYLDEEGNAVLASASAQHPSYMLMAKEIPPEPEAEPEPEALD